MSIFTGSGVAIITPFKQNGSIDFNSLKNIIDFQIKNDTDAIIVCGTTGEAATLTDQEKIDVIKFTINEVNQRVPVIAGAGSNSTSHCTYLCKEIEKLGADGLLLVTPYYNKTTQRGIINHYKTIAKSVDLPIILYNVPSRTGLNIEPLTVLELSKIENIVGMKEASGNISQVAKICSCCSDEFFVYSGNDDQILPVLSLGGKGAISVLGNIVPKDVHEIIKSFLDGDIKKSIAMQLRAIDLANVLFCEVNPIPVKTALSLMELSLDVFREPLINMEENNFNALKIAMEDYGINIQK